MSPWRTIIPRPRGRGLIEAGPAGSGKTFSAQFHDRAVVELRGEGFPGTRRPGFNEATTARSWNYCTPRRHTHQECSFNEATTARSWNCESLKDCSEHCVLASMRPRPRGRGII